jgi:hypothetical protein
MEAVAAREPGEPVLAAFRRHLLEHGLGGHAPRPPG